MSENEASGSQATIAGLQLEPPPLNSTKMTPRTNRSDGGSYGITALRNEIAVQMEGEFVITNVAEFFKSYMPLEPTDDDVETFVNSPSVKGCIAVQESDGLRFEDFITAPTKSAGTESDIFRPLQKIADMVSTAKVHGHSRNRFKYRVCPNLRINGGILGWNNMIDACITDDTNDTITAKGIAVVFEFKLDARQEITNNIQVVSANVQVMNDDARRMFSFGVTILGDRVTLWYHSRSHSAVSESFSFVEDPKMFIKVLMSFLFATEEELGYDPKIIHKDNGYLFIIPTKDEECPRFFLTVQSLSEYRSSNITGRMARIWEVAEYSSLECNPRERIGRFVLKDVWLDDSARTEDDIQESIFSDIETSFEPSSEDPEYTKLKQDLKPLILDKEYKKYFLAINAHYVGKKSKPLASCSKRKMGLLSSIIKPIVSRLTAATQRTSRTPHGTPRPTAMETDLTVTVPRDFACKKQYRVVFSEVCNAVGDLETLGVVVDVLQQTLVALRLMYCAGWVHRDISSGNILAHKEASGNWQAKLSDLEYARKYPPPPDYNSAVDPKTGTPYFMPHEILKLKPLFSAELETAASIETYGDLNPFSECKMANALPAPKPAVIYNFQHDLESLWWILVWTLTSRVSHNPSKDLAMKIFRNTTSMWTEREYFFIENIYQTLTTHLKPSLQPSFVPPLERLRMLMVASYRKRWKDEEIFDSMAYVKIHNYFSWFFKHLPVHGEEWRTCCLEFKSRASALQSTTAAPLFPEPVRSKRPREADDADYEPSDPERQSEEEEEEEEEEERVQSRGKSGRKKLRS